MLWTLAPVIFLSQAHFDHGETNVIFQFIAPVSWEIPHTTPHKFNGETFNKLYVNILVVAAGYTQSRRVGGADMINLKEV